MYVTDDKRTIDQKDIHNLLKNMKKEYVSPELWDGVVAVEQGFCQSQAETQAKIEDWSEEKFAW